MNSRTLVEELGRRLGVPLALDGAGLARLMVDGQLAIDFELDEARERLLVYAVIGSLPAGPGREALFAELLAAHLFDAETGGTAPALDRERGELLLWLALDTHADTERAHSALLALAGQVEHWRGRLLEHAGGQQATPAAAPGLPPAPDFGAFLRA